MQPLHKCFLLGMGRPSLGSRRCLNPIGDPSPTDVLSLVGDLRNSQGDIGVSPWFTASCLVLPLTCNND